MNILIIDDAQSRHDAIVGFYRAHWPTHPSYPHRFEHRYRPRAVSRHDLAWADIVWLDHDMCRSSPRDGVAWGRDGAPCPEPAPRGGCGCPTGVDVARRLVRDVAPDARPVAVVVHSANTAGAANIVAVLRAGGVSSASALPASRWASYDMGVVLAGQRRDVEAARAPF